MTSQCNEASVEDNDRYERWIKVSISTAKFEQFMMPNIQGLGRLDVQLLIEDQEFVKSYDNNNDSLHEDFNFSDQLTLSYLWVLGAYEAIRTMCQRIHENEDLVSAEMKQKFISAKNSFNRLRVPLAKMEPASAYKTTDSHIAYPGLNTSLGVTWKINENVYISRIELSDQMLSLLEEQRAEQIHRSISQLT